MSCSFYVDAGQLTSAKTAPYLIVLSTAFSVDPLIIGAYPTSSPSSSWSDERRASTYAKLLADGMGRGKGTNSIICKKSYFDIPTIFSNVNGLCSSQSDPVGRIVKMTDRVQ